MGTNSIKANLTKADTISEIILCLGADIKHEFTFLIVEGDDDIKFWKDIVNDKVTIFDSFSGKEGIKEVIQEHFSHIPRVIGIRDRDYECNSIPPNIFCYDYCCMEMMLIKNDDAFKSIYNEYYSGSLSSDELRYTLLEQLKYLSLIRKMNEVEKWEVRIEGVSINKAFDNTTKTIQAARIISKLNEINSNYFEIHQDKLLQINSENEINLSAEQLLNITQGHDFITLFSVFCRKTRGHTTGDKSIAAGLRCAYRKIDFISTALYTQIVSYEVQYALKIIT